VEDSSADEGFEEEDLFEDFRVFKVNDKLEKAKQNLG